jgi:ATP-dependent DNA helicase RecG
MDDRELESLLADLESDRVERTESATKADKIAEAICAFANDLPNHGLPGVLFIGVKDDGGCADLPITHRLLENLGAFRSDGNILPFPVMTVDKRSLRGCELAVVIVQPSNAPPVRYRGRVWIRVGPRRAIATAEEERRLSEKRRFRDLPFDLHPVSSASLDDLDLELFRRSYLPSSVSADVLAQNERPLDLQLASLRMTRGNPPVPTVLGLLTVGRDPQDFLPGAYIQFLRIYGTALTDPIQDQKQISGPISEQLRVLDEIFRAHVSIATDVTSGIVESRHPDFPLVALQQLATNAVMHRNYDGTNSPIRITWFSDRIEILSPGGPFGQVSIQNFGRPGITDYRNPHLAEAMKNLGFVQKFGMGIELARQALSKNGNPPPQFDVDASSVLVTLKKPE